MAPPDAQAASEDLTSPVVGVDIGGTKLLAVLVDPDSGVVAGEPIRVEAPTDADEAVAVVVDAVGRLLGPGARPGAVGVGVPGMVDRSGVLRFSPHLPGLAGAPLRPRLREAFPSVAVWVGNDATAAGWAEHAVGAGVGVDDQLMVTLGTGIGGGIIAGGRLVEGVHGFAGELGHMVVDPSGPACPCGQRGCWERYASGSGLGRLARDLAVAGRTPRVVELAGGDPQAVRGEHVTVAAAEGDAEAAGIMADFGWWLALGLANLTNVVDPALVVIGGGLVDAGAVLLDPLRAAFADLVEGPDERADVAIVPAALGPAAGAVGAALLAGARDPTR